MDMFSCLLFCDAEGARVNPVPHLPAGTVSHRYHGYSASRGVDPTGGVPGGG
ncbi:hypothetical protein F511_35055 [Dorcoceras hygrometricum]|uniref:Uncharacterized protein n=1 Tax=Dorcoceras hygrometricum TaxID=472368 RepID=A0A2Z7AL14_9LAMI|nr:hypothetical protein F511_35055 [Dorcoceras hygrometricum]